MALDFNKSYPLLTLTMLNRDGEEVTVNACDRELHKSRDGYTEAPGEHDGQVAASKKKASKKKPAGSGE